MATKRPLPADQDCTSGGDLAPSKRRRQSTEAQDLPPSLSTPRDPAPDPQPRSTQGKKTTFNSDQDTKNRVDSLMSMAMERCRKKSSSDDGNDDEDDDEDDDDEDDEDDNKTSDEDSDRESTSEDDDDDESSSNDENDEDDEDDEDEQPATEKAMADEQEITTLPLTQKPLISRPEAQRGYLEERLKNFLPVIEKANQQLGDGGEVVGKGDGEIDSDGDDGNEEGVKGEEPSEEEEGGVEMHLALGVLEEKKQNDLVERIGRGASGEEGGGGESVLDRLLGKQVEGRGGEGIQEVASL